MSDDASILERLVKIETRFDDYVANEKERLKSHENRLMLIVTVVGIVVTAITTLALKFI